ncbi:hypothetical protein Chor_013591 [Crotalus horridus]
MATAGGPPSAGETKVIYHLDEEETPYLVKIPVPAERLTLGHVKAALARPGAKYFFKSMDQDFGVVKEEITDDGAQLPCFNGRVVSWVRSPCPPAGDDGLRDSEAEPLERLPGVGWGGHRINGQSRLERHLAGYDSSSTLLTSELETTSLCDSEDDDAMSRFSSSTEQSSASRLLKRHRRRRKQRPPRLERTSSFSSVTDSTMSLNIITVTLNMGKDPAWAEKAAGESRVHSNERGDGGIYIGSIMKGGAVAADGRIEPGDMLLQVNDINFENMSNDDAVRVLREIVHKPGPIVLTVAKCWDPSPQGYFTLPRNEPIQPIDPAAWVSHSAALTGAFVPYPGSSSMSTITSGTSVTETERFDDFNLSIHTDMASVTKAMASPESGLEVRDRMWLKITIPDAFLGSDVVDWLYHHVEGFQDRREARKYASNLLKAGFIRHTVNKITFSEQCYYIFGDLSSCENYMANLSLNDNDGSSGASDQDTLAPLPLPGATPWPLMPTFPYQYPAPHPYSPQPPPYHELSSYSYGVGSAGSQQSEGSRSSGSNRSDGGGGSGGGRGAGRPKEEKPGADSKSGSGSESEYSIRSGSQRGAPAVMPGGEGSSQRSQHSLGGLSLRSHPSLHSAYAAPGGVPLGYKPMVVMMVPPPPPPASAAAIQPPGAPPVRDLGSVPPELTASRQSFHMAMGNPSEFFVDVM